MNWDTVITTLCNKISKPITSLFISAVFLSIAPNSVYWLGWVFVAIGLGSQLDNWSIYIPQIWSRFQRCKKIKEEISNLTGPEEDILKLMVSYNKQIMRAPDFENALLKKNSSRIQKLPSDIHDTFTSLDDKKLIYYSYPDFGPYSVTVNDCVWKLIKKIYKKNFNTANNGQS